MSSRKVYVDIVPNTDAFAAAMRKVIRSLEAWAHSASGRRWAQATEHHWPEIPARSRMHTAYDRRRRSRRGRR